MIQLSIVIPVTKMHGKLEALKNSVSKALASGAQIIIVHDYRDEKTSEELQEFTNQKNNENLILLEDRFGNPGSARNAGIKLSQREYLAFWDADDHPNVGLFMDFFRAMEINQTDLGIAEYSVRDVTRKIHHHKHSGENLEHCWEKIAIQPGLWRMIFKAEVSRKIEFPPLRMGEDQIFLALFLNNAQTIFLSHLDVYTYLLGVDGQLTGDQNAISDLISSLDILEGIIEKFENTSSKKIVEVMFLKMLLSSIKIDFWVLLSRLIRLIRMNPKLFVRLVSIRIFNVASAKVRQNV
jgi:glycosyltransferase involved in cell wall biosynthesis